VAELARPGKPKLNRILADEVERAGGEVIVACELSRVFCWWEVLMLSQAVDRRR
jgi:hypothetical protein